MQAPQFQLAYQEPFWSGIAPGATWRLDVIRDGVELEPISLSDKACYLVGRVPVCDIVLENDTISRQHAVFQSRPNGKLYLFDLGSTHGTFVSKKKVEPKVYVELEEGVHIKFGSSARIYIVAGGPPPPPPSEATEAQATAPEEPKLSKRKKRAEDFFIGNIEDAEKFVKRKEGEKRRKERGLQMKKKKEKEKKKRQGTDEFDNDDADEDDDEKKKENNASEYDSDDSDAPQNAGEADPDKLVVGAARSNWDEYEMEQEDDEYYDRAKAAKNEPVAAAAKALTREDIVNRKIDLDLRVRDLEVKIAAASKSTKQHADDEEDALDAYMKVVASEKEAEQVKKMQAEKEALEKERKKMDRLLEAATGTLERLQERDKTRPNSLQSRISAVLDKGFVAPAAKRDKVEEEEEEVVERPVVAVAPSSRPSGKSGWKEQEDYFVFAERGKKGLLLRLPSLSNGNRSERNRTRLLQKFASLRKILITKTRSGLHLRIRREMGKQISTQNLDIEPPLFIVLARGLAKCRAK
jgi:pSer/pThr/pTyr-binding forkhead associated (FHA) protein